MGVGWGPELMEETGLEIRRGGPADAAQIAALWSICEPRSVWTKLGPRLAEIYFRRYCQDEHELAITAWLGGALAGACLGTDRPATSKRAFYLEHRTELLRTLGRELLTRPQLGFVLLTRIGRGISAGILGRGRNWHGARPEISSPRAPSPTRACYMSNFFVAPAARGRQLGSLMLRCFCSEMASRGCDVCVAHTTADNVASQIAQRRAGMECVHRQGEDLVFMRRLTS